MSEERRGRLEIWRSYRVRWSGSGFDEWCKFGIPSFDSWTVPRWGDSQICLEVEGLMDSPLMYTTNDMTI